MDDKQALKLYIVLSRAYRTVAEADKREIREYGLSPSEFTVLELLYHKGPMPVQQIAGKVLLTSGSMTYVISRMEEKNLVKRIACEHDRRIYYVGLTNPGQALIHSIFPSHQAFMHSLLDVMEGEEAERLIAQLKMLGKAVEERQYRSDTR